MFRLEALHESLGLIEFTDHEAGRLGEGPLEMRVTDLSPHDSFELAR